MNPFDDGPSASSGRSLFNRSTTPLVYPVPPPRTFIWNDEQLRAVDEILRWRRDYNASRYMKLTGPGGVGKTEVLCELRKRLTGQTMWSATTGKAALRLRHAVHERTKTFHAALYGAPDVRDNDEEGKIDLEFVVRKDNDAEGALLVVDESAMLGMRAKRDLDDSSFSKVLLVGDPYQLPSTEQGSDDYSIFTDMVGPHLLKVMRNSGAVLAAATLVREQHRIPLESGEDGGSRYDYVEHATAQNVTNVAAEAWLDDREGHTLIAWKNESRTLVNAIVRHRLGYTDPSPNVGEPLVVRKNIHKKGLMNGDIVRCEEIGPLGPTLAGVTTRWFTVCEEISGRTVEILAPSADFTGALPYVRSETWRGALKEAQIEDVCPLTYAYCLTAHLAQGSQYRRVTVMIPGDFRSANFNKTTRLPDGTLMPFSMRWLYTAVSRSVKHTSLFLSK